MKKRDKIRGTILLVIGSIALILAVVCYNYNDGNYEWDQTYGGDAYTGIQNAAAQAANNSYYGNKIIKFGLISILSISGATLITVGGTLFIPQSSTERIECMVYDTSKKTEEIKTTISHIAEKLEQCDGQEKDSTIT